MPPVNESAVAATELERMLPKVEKVYESDRHFYNFIKKRPVEIVSMREMRVPMEIAPGGSFGYFDPNGGDLGRGSGPRWDNATVKPVFMKEAIEYTKLAQWSTDDRRKAIINSVRKLTAGALVELQRQIDAQLQQPGTGQIGTISGVTTAGGVDTYALNSDGFGARLVREQQIVQIYSADLLTLRGSGRITVWDEENKSIKVTPAVAGAIATDVLITEGLTAPATLPALYGVPYHHSNASVGTWLGYDRATTPQIRSNRINAGGSALSLAAPRLAMSKIGNRLGMDRDFKVTAWTHPAQAAAYEEMGMLISSIQKTSKDDSLNLYFGDNMQLAGAPIRTHWNWNPKRIDFIVDSVWGRAEILPIGFYMTDGRKIFEIRGASGGVATADIFYMVNGFQTFVTNPAATAYIDNLAVPAGY
jgi:hypothetical protein